MVIGDGTTTVVGSMRLPVSVGIAYGGSKRPKRPQALHGYAHELTCFGAARMGSQAASTMVTIAVGSAVRGQLVPRSLRLSWLVAPVPLAMVETSYRSRGRIHCEVEGPAGCPSVLIPLAAGMYMYTEGDVLVSIVSGWVLLDCQKG